tara:strand:- start:510 stop:1007 length:498 start_codon:yes stop_codon:yes gene_type:complete
MKGLVQNQLKNQSLGTVKPAAFKQVGGVIFPDSTANMDMAKLSSIVEAFQSVHSPNYGQPIPQSSEIHSVVGNESLITLTGNEVALVNAISCTNGGGAPITVQIKVGTMILAVVQLDPASTIPMNSNGINIGSFYLDSLNAINISVTEGNPSDLTTTALTMRVCQ